MKKLFFLTSIVKINFEYYIIYYIKKKIKKYFLTKIFIKIYFFLFSIPGKCAFLVNTMNLKKHGVMGVLETNFGGVIFSEVRLENFSDKSLRYGSINERFNHRKGLTSFAVYPKRAVAKSFDTESGGWNRNSVEGAGFDTIRVARCHKIHDGSLVLAVWNELSSPLEAKHKTWPVTARYRTTRSSNEGVIFAGISLTII